MVLRVRIDFPSLIATDYGLVRAVATVQSGSDVEKRLKAKSSTPLKSPRDAKKLEKKRQEGIKADQKRKKQEERAQRKQDEADLKNLSKLVKQSEKEDRKKSKTTTEQPPISPRDDGPLAFDDNENDTESDSVSGENLLYLEKDIVFNAAVYDPAHKAIVDGNLVAFEAAIANMQVNMQNPNDSMNTYASIHRPYDFRLLHWATGYNRYVEYHRLTGQSWYGSSSSCTWCS